MFTELVESRPKRERSRGGAVASIIFHAGVATLLVVATAIGDPPPRHSPVELFDIHPPISPAPQTPRPTTSVSSGSPSTAAPPPPTMPTLPTIDPVGIPPIDMNAAPVNPDDFRRVGAGSPSAAVSSTPGTTGETFEASYVERMAVPSASNVPPRYPEILRTSALDGRVDLLFVVDTLGRVEPATIETLASTNELFTRAARDALLRWHFSPAEVRSHKVRVRMQQPFIFTITH